MPNGTFLSPETCLWSMEKLIWSLLGFPVSKGAIFVLGHQETYFGRFRMSRCQVVLLMDLKIGASQCQMELCFAPKTCPWTLGNNVGSCERSQCGEKNYF